MSQDAAPHAIGKRFTLREALFELAPRVSLGCLVRQLLLLVTRARRTVVAISSRKAVVVIGGRKAAGGATWLDQNQLLHLPSCARFELPSSAATNQTPPADTWFSAERPFRPIEIFPVRFPAARAVLPGWIHRRSLHGLAGSPPEPGRLPHRKPERVAFWRRRIPRCLKGGGGFALTRRAMRSA